MLSGHFISGSSGKLLLTQFGDFNGDRAVLCLPSITEEMNLSRAVVAKQAQALAASGFPCVVLDYFGTGDSEGEFDETSGQQWVEDILSAGQWLLNHGVTEIILWGVRFGCVLALANQEQLHQKLPIVRQIYWKPVLNGKLFAGQFLRIKQANAMLTDGGEKINWRNHILSGNTTEVAGYQVTEKLLRSIEELVVSDDFQPRSRIDIFDLAVEKPTPIINKLVAKWPSEKYQVQSYKCPQFWQVPEIFSLPELVELNLPVFLSEH